jgi:hypothetical protein
MGKRMPHQEKNNSGRYNQLTILLPITGTIFSKKPIPMESPAENSIDFHLTMIKKIDNLLAEHEPETLAAESFHAPPIIPAPAPSPIEPRPPLNKTLSHRELAWEPSIEPSCTTTRTIPEEFKTELTLNPEFKFITSQEFKDTIFQIKPPAEERVEILDLSSLFGDNTTFKKTTSCTTPKNHAKEKPRIEDHHHKRIEVIDTRSLKQKIYEDVLNNAMKQTEQSEKKSQLYYLSSKDNSDKKQKKLEIEQTYIPVDFEERSKELKEQQNEEEEQKQQQDEKIHKQLEREHEKLEKLETKKAILEEKKQELKQKEKKPHKKEPQLARTKRETKKQEKEQKRLQRLEIRQARIEEKRRKKEEKRALKTKQKQQHLKNKGKEKPQKLTKQKTESKSLFKKEKHPTSLELDEDIKKILIMTDTLLGELPEDVINRFAQSEDFELYEKIMNKYKIK